LKFNLGSELGPEEGTKSNWRLLADEEIELRNKENERLIKERDELERKLSDSEKLYEQQRLLASELVDKNEACVVITQEAKKHKESFVVEIGELLSLRPSNFTSRTFDVRLKDILGAILDLTRERDSPRKDAIASDSEALEFISSVIELLPSLQNEFESTPESQIKHRLALILKGMKVEAMPSSSMSL